MHRIGIKSFVKKTNFKIALNVTLMVALETFTDGPRTLKINNYNNDNSFLFLENKITIGIRLSVHNLGLGI